MIKKAIVSFLILSLLFTFFTPVSGGMQKVNAKAGTYYVSSSSGNDQWPGTLEKPWKTLAKVSAVTFNAGDKILLKCNDTWEGEALYLKGHGNSKNWITLSTYGKGKKPAIIPGMDSLWAIKLVDNAGWKISGLEICKAQTGITFWNWKPGERDGLWIEDCIIHDIENAPLYPDNKEKGLYMSYGISTYTSGGERLKNVTIKNCIITNTDAPMRINGVNNITVDGCTTDYSYRAGIQFEGVNVSSQNTGVMKNCKVFNSGYKKGMYWGVAGVQFNVCKYFVLQDCEIAYTRAPDCPDGVGVDYEGNNEHITTLRCSIHDNDSSAFLVYKNPEWGTDNIDTSIKDCVIYSNGLKNPNMEPAFLRHYHNLKNGGSLTGNKITKTTEMQSVNWIDPLLTDRMPKNYTTANNVINKPDPKKKYAAPMKNKYSFTDNFSRVQGDSFWFYQQQFGKENIDLVWNSPTSSWVGKGSVITIARGWMHPDKNSDAVLKWVAPRDGKILVQGSVKKSEVKGNGVKIFIKKNDQLIWEGGVITDTTGKSHMLEVAVKKGDLILFIVNDHGDIRNDATLWNPVIEYRD